MADLSKRYSNQIRNLLQVATVIHEKFEQKLPLDQSLSRYFRKNPKFGSFDRRFISNSIFGYYRWYGWLQKLDKDQKSLALLLGYLLDDNELNELILFWCREIILPDDFLQNFDNKGKKTIHQKLEIVGQLIPEAELANLVPLFIDALDEEDLEAIQTRASVWIRLEKADNQDFIDFLTDKKKDFHRHPRLESAIEIYTAVNLNESEDFRSGLVVVQDISSQLVGVICDPQPNEIWLDLCAGSGGKSLHLASLMGGTGVVEALEIRESMMDELERRILRSSWKNIFPHPWDGIRIPEFKQKFDGILLDVPCSGSGTWRRMPDMRWHLSPATITQYAKTQKDILAKASQLVRAGGRLIYSTCSLLKEENQAVVQAFLQNHPDFAFETIKHPLTGQDTKQGVAITPCQVRGNAMYIASLKRK